MNQLNAFFLVMISFFSCAFNEHKGGELPLNKEHIYAYDTLSLPHFFDSLFTRHYASIKLKFDEEFEDICRENDLEREDEANAKMYFRILFYHKLLTSQSASNGNNAGILKIPYFWHWVNPNPRHQIIYLPGERLLSKIKPPAAFGKYASYADIDRTPSLFFSDLLSEKPGFYHSDCDTFYSFGWCSEREMAYVGLLNLFDIQGKVMTGGNHSWSESYVKMVKNDKKVTVMSVTVDNTFDEVTWKNLGLTVDTNRLMKSYPQDKLTMWYNTNAVSDKQKTFLLALKVYPKASARIEKLVVDFLNH